MDLFSAARAAFQQEVWSYYNSEGRHDLPWRKDISPYSIVISEVMLQQTQVSRVLIKYPEFMNQFPSFADLAVADLSTILIAWQGMGYNRRARFLQQLAIKVTSEFVGMLPSDPSELLALPGIGKATASSVAAFAFNVPTVFIETNIRRVFIHHFFPTSDEVNDRDIAPLVERTLDRERPREWYWALMDYGTYLSKHFVNANRKSRHYKKQSRFSGSVREARGIVLRLLLEGRSLSLAELLSRSLIDEGRLSVALELLTTEGFIKKTGRLKYSIVGGQTNNT